MILDSPNDSKGGENHEEYEADRSRQRRIVCYNAIRYRRCPVLINRRLEFCHPPNFRGIFLRINVIEEGCCNADKRTV